MFIDEQFASNLKVEKKPIIEIEDNKEPLTDSSQDTSPNKEPSVYYSMSGGLVALFQELHISVAISSYQSGKFYLLGQNPKGGLMIDERIFPKAMGICVDNQSIILASLFQIHRFENILQPGQFINHIFDACYVPRISYTTGALDTHDIGVMYNNDIVFVNTRFNCLATLSPTLGFIPRWKPSFISKIIDEDRCHLNGMAMDEGLPRYVTSVSRSDTIDGWRDRRKDGGVVIDVAQNEIVCANLSMPHSPRIYDGKLWILNSGTGELGWVDTAAGSFHPIAFCPGFLRGLAFHRNYAFIGLSKPRYARFEGLPLDEKLIEADSEPWCGMQIIDLNTGRCVEWFRIDGSVTEIYDVRILNGISCPMALGFASTDIKSLITHESFIPFDRLNYHDFN